MSAPHSDYYLRSFHGAEYDALGHNCQFDKHVLKCNVEHDDCQSSSNKVLIYFDMFCHRKMNHLVDHCLLSSSMSARDFEFSESMVYEQNLIFHWLGCVKDLGAGKIFRGK